jgi:hypothetical protein
MWWMVGIAIWVMLLAVIVALCRVAKNADRRMADSFEEMLAERRQKVCVFPSDQKHRAA